MNTNWMRSADVVWEEVNGEAVVIRPKTNARWLLNAAAAAVWKSCDGVSRIRNASEFCHKLASLGLIQPVDGQACLSGAGASFQMGANDTPLIRQLSAGGGGRRRPSPRGVSGPV